MHRTRISLFYLAGYLLTGGIGFLAAPQLALSLFMASGEFTDLMTRLTGMMLLGLGIVIVQIIRLRIEALYPTTLVVRTVLLAILVWLYVTYRDTLLIVLLAIVGLGFVLTMTSYLWDRSSPLGATD